MNGRAVWVLMGVAGLATAACSKGTNNDDKPSATRLRAAVTLPPIMCSLEPWANNGQTCGDTSLEHRVVTCGDLGLNGVTLTPGAPDSSGYRVATHVEGDIDSEVTGHDVTSSAWGPSTDWSFAATVNPDGSTMMFDALLFHGGGDTYVVKFSSPQYNVHDLFLTLGQVDTIDLCGYRSGRTPTLPPPHPDAGPFTVTCSGNGATTFPGTTIHNPSEIQWAVKVDPPPPQGATVWVNAEVDNSVGLGTSYAVLNSGQLSGGYANDYLKTNHGSVSLTFGYGDGSCTMVWNLQPASSPDAGSSGGHSW